MAEFRIKNGLALGPFGGDLAYIGGAGSVNQLIFNQAVGTPNVSLSPIFFTANTSTTVYTNFLSDRPGFIGTEEPPDGKVVIVMFKDDSSSVTNQTRMFLSTTLGTFGSGGVLGLISIGSAWYELFRTQVNVRASDTTRTEIATVTVANSFSFDATFVRVVNVISTAANTVLQSISGGQAYQEVTVVPTYAPGSTLFVSASGNIVVAGTGTFLMSNSGTYKFMYVPSGGGGTAFKWLMLKGAAAV